MSEEKVDWKRAFETAIEYFGRRGDTSTYASNVIYDVLVQIREGFKELAEKDDEIMRRLR